MIFGNKKISTEKPAFVMGILNATPDSFFEKSRGGIDLALKLIDDGADILDIGGESTRPGYIPVDEDEEIKRIVPLIKEIRNHSQIPISVDTRKSKVFKEAFYAGADILNDVSALEDDKKMAEVCAKTDCSVILMHRWKENPNKKDESKNIIKIVSDYLENQIGYALFEGVDERKIIIDPGIGFGKTFEENINLIKNCNLLCDGKYPILMALSRKRCIGQMTDETVENRMAGTLAANILSVQNNSKIVRVHDVKQTVDSLNVMKYLQK